MKSFAALLCLASLAVNTAAGFAGSVLFCEHETGDFHLVSKAAHATETHGEWCHRGTPADQRHSVLACDSCTDTEIDSRASLSETTPGPERTVVKSPQTSDHFQIGGRFSIPRSLLASKPRLARAPPVVSTGISQFTDTIQFRC